MMPIKKTIALLLLGAAHSAVAAPDNFEAVSLHPGSSSPTDRLALGQVSDTDFSGRYVIYAGENAVADSNAILTAINNSTFDRPQASLFLRDTVSNTTTLLAGTEQLYGNGCISPNGEYIAYATSSGVFRYNRLTDTTESLASRSANEVYFTHAGCVSDAGIVVSTRVPVQDPLAIDTLDPQIAILGDGTPEFLGNVGNSAGVPTVNPFATTSGITVANGIAGFTGGVMPQISSDGQTIVFQARTYLFPDNAADATLALVDAEPVVYNRVSAAYSLLDDTYEGTDPALRTSSLDDPILQTARAAYGNVVFDLGVQLSSNLPLDGSAGLISSALFLNGANSTTGALAIIAIVLGRPNQGLFDYAQNADVVTYRTLSSENRYAVIGSGSSSQVNVLGGAQSMNSLEFLNDVVNNFNPVAGSGVPEELFILTLLDSLLTYAPTVSHDGSTIAAYTYPNLNILGVDVVLPQVEILDVASGQRSAIDVSANDQLFAVHNEGFLNLNGDGSQLLLNAALFSDAEFANLSSQIDAQASTDNGVQVPTSVAVEFLVRNTVYRVATGNSPTVPSSTVTVVPESLQINTAVDSVTQFALEVDAEAIFALDVRCQIDGQLMQFGTTEQGSLFPQDALRVGPSRTAANTAWQQAVSLAGGVGDDGVHRVPDPLTTEQTFTTVELALERVSGRATIDCESEASDSAGNSLTVSTLDAVITLDNGINPVDGPGQNITGVVLVPEGVDPADVTVSLTIGDVTVTTGVDANGVFTFENIRDGVFDLTVGAQRTIGQCINGTLAGETFTTNDISLFRGDINNDGTIDIADFTFLSSRFGLSEGDDRFRDRADLNKDGTINIQDLAILASHMGLSMCETQSGDGNGGTDPDPAPDVTPASFIGGALIREAGEAGVLDVQADRIVLQQNITDVQGGQLAGIFLDRPVTSGKRAIEVTHQKADGSSNVPSIGLVLTTINDGVSLEQAFTDATQLLSQPDRVSAGVISTLSGGNGTGIFQSSPVQQLEQVTEAVTAENNTLRLVFDYDTRVLQAYIAGTSVGSITLAEHPSAANGYWLGLPLVQDFGHEAGDQFIINTNVTPDAVTPDILPWGS